MTTARFDLRVQSGFQTLVLITAFFVVLCGFALPADAADISLFNTGVDANGSKLSGGAIDPHWKLVAGPGVTAPADAVVVTNQNPGGCTRRLRTQRGYGQTLVATPRWEVPIH